MQIEKKQIWQDCNNRIKRFVEIIDVSKKSALVTIATVYSGTIKRPEIRENLKSAQTVAQRVRFGHSKGYRFIANNIHDFLDGDNDFTRQGKKRLDVLDMHGYRSCDQIWLDNASLGGCRYICIDAVGDKVAVHQLFAAHDKSPDQDVISGNRCNERNFSDSCWISIEEFKIDCNRYSLVAENYGEFKAMGLHLGIFDNNSGLSKHDEDQQALQEISQPSLVTVKVDQVWRVNDNRTLRYVHVRKVSRYEVSVVTLVSTRVHGGMVLKPPLSRMNALNVIMSSRFNGKSNGLSLVAESLVDFKAKGLDFAIYDKNAGWAVAPVFSDNVVKKASGRYSDERLADIAEARSLVASKQLWQERMDRPHFVEVIDVQGDYALLKTRYIGDGKDEIPIYCQNGCVFEIRLINFLPKFRKYHLISKL